MEAVHRLSCLSQVLQPQTFHGHSKGLFGRDIGLTLAQNPVLSFLPWKEDQFGFSGSVNDLHVSISDMTLFVMSIRRTKEALYY